MKTIKNIRVNVTYTAGIGNIKVDDKTYEALLEFAATGREVNWSPKSKLEETAFEWLNSNIRERDCCQLEYEITDIEKQP